MAGRIGRTLGAAATAALGHNLVQMLRLKAVADRQDHELDHDGVVGTAYDGAPALRLAVLGDSAADGLGVHDAELAYPRLVGRGLAEQLGRPVEIRSIARRGLRTRHVTAEQVPQLAALRPDVVTISAGANDVLGRVPPPRVARDTHDLIAALRSTAPQAVLFLGTSPRFGDAPALPAPTRWVLHGLSLAVRRTMLEVAAEEGVPAGALPRLAPDDFSPDGFHGGIPAHRLAADLTLATLRPHIAHLRAR